MKARGQIVGGGLTDISIREKGGMRLELGDLLVVENNGRDYTILQVKDIAYRSQASQSTHELLAGMELEGHGTDLEFMEPELTNYIIARAKALLQIHKYEDETKKEKYKVKIPKRLPNFFNPIRSIEGNDLEFLKPEKPENSLYLGKVRSGSEVLIDVDVYIDAVESLTHHILIPATTGRGKSNLVKVMLWSLLDSEDVGILVLDPHDEYYGRYEKGLKDHPESEENLVYYSMDPPRTKGTLMIHIESLHPNHFKGIINFSDAQNDAIWKLYNNYKKKWIFELLTKTDLKYVEEKTLGVLKRKFENILKIYADDNQQLKYRKSKKIFRFGDSGQSSLDKIIESLKSGKIVIIDTSRLNDKEELLIGSIISGALLNEYKSYGSKELKNEPVISIVIEEAPRVLGKDVLSGQGDNIYSTIAREGRKFKIGLIAITQLASLIPRTVLANMNTKIILGNEMSLERSAIIDSASQDLSDDNRIIASLDKGEAIVSSVFTRFAVPIYTQEFEKYIEDYMKKLPKKKKIKGKTMPIG